MKQTIETENNYKAVIDIPYEKLAKNTQVSTFAQN